MKMTIEIADDLFRRVQTAARREKTTFDALIERGLTFVLREDHAETGKWKWKPLVVQGRGMTKRFKNAGWARLLDGIYRGRGT